MYCWLKFGNSLKEKCLNEINTTHFLDPKTKVPRLEDGSQEAEDCSQLQAVTKTSTDGEKRRVLQSAWKEKYAWLVFDSNKNLCKLQIKAHRHTTICF